ncbi:hypothetical protein RN001_011851 [Aquatica leii]|uniref:Uncharacterized protein n=1 Tax=Aquatica leii TaxID=1421715 RepID=A0AAN7SEU7_9COLE|nr:hypothetical protein RN001_011851 [Aquatica leii]
MAGSETGSYHSSAPELMVSSLICKAMANHREMGKLKNMSQFDLEWLSKEYLKQNTGHTEIHDAWEKLPLSIRNDDEMKSYRLCTKHWNLPEQRVHIDGPPPQIRHCFECKKQVK